MTTIVEASGTFVRIPDGWDAWTLYGVAYRRRGTRIEQSVQGVWLPVEIQERLPFQATVLSFGARA